MYPHIALMDVAHARMHACTHACMHANETYRSPVYSALSFNLSDSAKDATSCTGSIHVLVVKVHPQSRDWDVNGFYLFRDTLCYLSRERDSHSRLYFIIAIECYIVTLSKQVAQFSNI